MGRSEWFNVGRGISNLAKAMEPFNKKYESSEDAAEDLNARAEMDEGK